MLYLDVFLLSFEMPRHEILLYTCESIIGCVRSWNTPVLPNRLFTACISVEDTLHSV